MNRKSMWAKILVAVFVLALVVSCASRGKRETTTGQQPQVAQVKVLEPGQDWKLYLESQDRKFYFDSSTIQRYEGRYVRVWERITDRGKDDDTDRVKSLIDLDCKSSKYRVVVSREYDAATKTEKEVRTENESFTYFDLESILGVLWNNVCFAPGTSKEPPQKKEEPKKK